MGMDYAGLNSGLGRGLLIGQQLMRTKQQDDRQATLDAESRQDRVEERGMRRADRAYQEEERTYAKAKRSKTDAREAAQERLNILRALGTDEHGQPKALDENDIAVLGRIIQSDEEIQKEFVSGNPDAVGFAGFRPGEGKYHGKVVPMLQMREGYGYGSEEDGSFSPQPYAPLTKDRKRDGEVTALTPEEIRDNLINLAIERGAKFDYYPVTKAKDQKTVEIGAGNGMKTQAVLNPDGTVTPIGKPYAQFDPDGGRRGGAGGELPAEAKLIDYYIAKHNMTPEAARKEAKRAKDNPRKWAGDHYNALVKLEAERLLEDGETRRTPAELQAQALADAEFFFGGDESPKAATPAGGGMAFAPSLATRPPYQGPVRAGMAGGGMARNPNIEEAQVISETPRRAAPSKGVKAEMSGDKVTFGGKQYQAVNGIVVIDGKKYRVQ